MTNPYETDALLRQYLEFHYQSRDPDYLPLHDLSPGVLAYPARCARLLIRHTAGMDRALDLGCSVGGSAFELASAFDEVVGIDFSARFIEAASTLAETGQFRLSETEVVLPSEARNARPEFRVGDACALPADLGVFDGILMANLLCRLPDPGACLEGLRRISRPGSVLVFTTPCSWDEAYTPKSKWLFPTLPALQEQLGSWCELLEDGNIPFVLRDHERRCQYTVAQFSVWRILST